MEVRKFNLYPTAQVSKGFDVLEAEFAAVYAAKSCLARETLQVKKMREELEEWVTEQRADLQRWVN